LLDDSGEELQNAASNKRVNIMAMSLQGVQELVSSFSGCFFQLIAI
jgi:hypothetical protein